MHVFWLANRPAKWCSPQSAMFFRLKPSGPRTYLQIVENRRENGVHRQHVIATLGRADELAASGALASLLASGARLCDQVMLLSALERDAEGLHLSTRRIGGPLLFGRLWEQTGCEAVIKELLAGRGFELDVERAIFATVLHRLFASGSDRACDKWIEAYTVPGTDELALHHLDRAMTGVPIERVRWAPPWLGEELDAADGGQAHATPFAPRCVKDQIEEALFARRRDLFSELSIVFMDTTSLSFQGAGGETLGQRGHSKDHRPDLMPLILCVVIDAEGRPICTEIMPGNTADVRVLLPTIDRLRHRFAMGRFCIVADRGMISAATIAGLEERGLEYILGARERTDRLVRAVVLADERAFTPLLIERANGAETQLFAKEVRHAGRRYVVCRNEAEAEKDRADRQAIIAGLEQQLQRGDKALIGNSAYRRYLRRVTTPGEKGGKNKPAPRPSKSMPASWLTRPGTTASSCCAPTPASRRYRLCSDIANCSKWKRCSARRRACYAPARSTTPPTPPSVATSSAPSSPWCCRRSCSSAAGPQASPRNGTMCCATLTGYRWSRWPRRVSGSGCARPPPALLGHCSRLPASPCRRTSATPRRADRLSTANRHLWC